MDDRSEAIESTGSRDMDEECLDRVTDEQLAASIAAILDPNKPMMTGKEIVEFMTQNNLFDPRPEMPDSPTSGPDRFVRNRNNAADDGASMY